MNKEKDLKIIKKKEIWIKWMVKIFIKQKHKIKKSKNNYKRITRFKISH